MDNFTSLIEEENFNSLIEEPQPTDPPKGVKTPNVASPIDAPFEVMPRQEETQGPTAQKYGMGFNPDMYMPKEMPIPNITEGELDVEKVHEAEHEKYFVSEEARRAIDKGNKESMSQGLLQIQRDVDPPRIDPDLLKPGATEYLMDKLSNETLVGKASILLTGTLQAAVQGGDPVEYYRDIYDANNETIMAYKPNQLQEMATGVLAVTLDLPIFEGIGSIYNSAAAGTIKAATKYTSDQAVKAGMTRALADQYAKNGLMQLNAMLQTGTILGTHSGLNDIATQIADGAELGDINWNQTLDTGGQSFVLGGALGAWGVGSNYIKNSPAMQRMVDGSVRGRLVEKGLMAASFGGEVSLFTYGEALLDGERRWYDVSGEEFLNATAVILNLKAIHSKAKLPKGRGMFNGPELEAIKKHTKTGKDPMQTLVEDPAALEKVFADKNTPYSLKAKVAKVAGVEVPMPVVDNVKRTDLPNGGVKVETFAGKTPVQTESFASPSDAHRFFNDVETGISEMGVAGEAAKLKPQYQTELDRNLEKAGVEGGIANQKMLEAVQQLPSMRTVEQKKLANTFFDTFEALKTEKTTAVEGKPAEDIFTEAPKVEPDPVIEPAAIQEGLKPYTPEQIELKYEAHDRLQTKIDHPVNGIDKMLGDLQAIREAGDYTDASINSKTIRNYFPEVAAETLKLKSEAEVTAAENKFKEVKAGVEAELARRTKAGEPTVGTGNFVLGRMGFETKADLFRELDKFPTLENTLPEIFDFETMKAVQEYETLKAEGPQYTGKQVAENIRGAAEKLRAKKGGMKPGPGELRVGLPYMSEAYDFSIEVMARAMEGGAGAVEAIGKAIDGIKAQSWYQDLSAIEQKRLEKDLIKKLREDHNLAVAESERVDNGQQNESFFTDKSKEASSKVPYEPIIKIDATTPVAKAYKTYSAGGNFTGHISKMIPGFQEKQIRVAEAITKSGANSFLDIGASEGGLVKTVASQNKKMRAVAIDPNSQMKKNFDSTPEVKNAEFKQEAFQGSWTEADGTKINEFKPTEKFDVVNEDFTFQFVNNDRVAQVAGVKELMTEDGIFITSEKFHTANKKANEAKKADHQEKYFTPEERTADVKGIVTGMDKDMVKDTEYFKILKDNFKYVEEFWNAGEFKGYLASDSKLFLDNFKSDVGDLTTEFTDNTSRTANGKLSPKTTKQKAIDKELKRPINKLVVNEYTALKDQIKTQGKIAKDIAAYNKQAGADIAKLIGTKDFQKAMGARTTKTMARRLATMDPQNPAAVAEALNYIDKAITDAKFREELAEIDKVYDKLDKQTTPESYQKKENNVLKGKSVTPETQDKLKDVRQNMLEGDWKKAQAEIDKLQESLGELGDPINDAILDKIDELSFHGLLNDTGAPSLGYMNSKLADIQAIRKHGRTVEGARRMIRAEERATRITNSFDVLNSGKKKVVLDPEKAANLEPTAYEKAARNLDWTSTDSWFTFLDKLSKYDKTSSPMRSFLNTEFGGKVIEAEQAEYVSKSAQLEKVQTKAREIFGVETRDALDKVLKKNTTDIHTMKWDKGETLDITMNQAYKKWMELQDPTIMESHMKQGYLDQSGDRTAKYDALEKVLSPEAKKWAEWQLNEFFPEYWETINPVYREVYGTDMPRHDNYSPIFVADKLMSSDAAVDHMMTSMDFRGMGGNNHMKLRSNHAKELLLLDGDQVLMNYMSKMEFFKAWSKGLKDMSGTFNDRTIRESIRQNFGPNYLNTLGLFLDDFAKKPKNIANWEKIADKVRANFTIGSLAFKPTVLLKQLTSFPAYADNIPTTQFMKGLADYVTHPKEVNAILAKSPYMMERYAKGWDRDISIAMQRDAKAMISGKNLKATEAFMFLVKYGDKAAIVMGGWPVYKHHYDRSMQDGLSVKEAEAVAMKEFEYATRNSQQATGIADMSTVQRHNTLSKWLTMYKTSPLQYHRKVMGATRNMVHGRGTVSENLKTLAIYHVLLPQLFQMASNGFKWDGEDQAWALGLGNFNNVFAAGDALQGLVNHIRKLPFDYNITPVESLIKDSYKAGDELVNLPKIIKDLPNTSIEDVLDAVDKLGKVSGHWSGTPVNSVMNTASGIVDAVKGNTDYPARRVLGYSENSLKGGRELWDLPDNVKKMINENMGNQKKSFDELLEDNGNPTSFEDLIE